MKEDPQQLHQITYLNESDLDSLQISMSSLVSILEELFQLMAEGRTLMPPKIFFHLPGDRFYSAMASCCPPLGYAASKWQSGDPANPSRGLPYIQGLLVVTENESGQMVAIMDAKWVTGKRTAAASALVVRYQARQDAEVLALLGCGVQGRAHLEAIAGEVATLTHCHVFDTVPERQAAFVDEMSGRFNGIQVIGEESAEQAIRKADIVITGGPIQVERRATIPSGWIKSGALVVTIDYDSYVTDECINAMDIVVTDDRGQIEDAREKEGKFEGVRRIDADIAQMVSHGTGVRENQEQRIIAFNLGIALEDVATATEILRQAKKREIGILLDP